MNNIYDISTKLERVIGKRDHIKSQLNSMQSNIIKLNERKENIEKAQVFLQDIAQKTQEQLRYHIEDIVQLCLDIVFPDKYKFNMIFEVKRGKTEAKLIFMDDGEEVDPMDASGGGVVDIAALALRIAGWSLSKTDNVIVLDEPFRFISNDKQALAAEVLKELSKTLNLQFIIVTHRPEIVDIADSVFNVKLIKKDNWDVSEVSRL